MSKVLLVEDNPTLREMYATTLRNAGFDLETAEDGEEGLAKITSFMPDIILLDLLMPKKSGFEVVEEMKKQNLLEKIPVVIMTDLFADKQEFLSLGVTDFILKPDYTPAQVVEKVNKILSENKTSSNDSSEKVIN